MRTELLWAAIVATGLLIPAGVGGAAECSDFGSTSSPSTLPWNSFGPSPGQHVELNASNDKSNSTIAFNGGIMGPARICHISDTPQSGQTVDPPHRASLPPWPEVTSLSTDFLSSKAVKVHWTTNVPTVGRVVWGPSGRAPTGTAPSDVFATEHSVWVRGLTPGETYAFHLIIFDGNARAELSNAFQLTTPLPPRDNSVDALLVAASVGTTLGICYVIWRRTP